MINWCFFLQQYYKQLDNIRPYVDYNDIEILLSFENIYMYKTQQYMKVLFKATDQNG